MKTAGAYRILAVALLLAVSSVSWAANSKTQVGQVTSTVNVSGNEDYTVTSETPFANGGVVNIQNTDHAVLILTKVKPSAAIPLLTGHVQINGAQAVNGENCQVKMYGQGTIVLPYGDATKPLTVYSGQNFTGTAVNDFGLEDSGGFMNTLTAAKLNNQIRSFKLKRGYMVTFALRPGGYGYSRCFIAADQDLEVATLPDILDQKISSYRVFKWYDASKKGVAARGGNTAECAALNVTSTYSWGIGQNMGPDVECVPHHIKENWPVAADLGKATWSPHMKTNNEPQNTADDPWVAQSRDEILANWEGLMATGMRLCSPSSWDGSDYWNATGFLAGFFEEIDKRGWRCDIIDLHCYWPEANFGNIKNYADKFNRPVWVSEWVWGASWGDNYGSKGAFNDGVTESQNATTIQRICQQMNGMSYVERYFYWDDERDPTKLWKNGSLTTTGSTYSTLDCGLGYNGQKNYVPSPPPVEAPSKLTTVTAAGKVSLKWYEPNGELTQSMALEYSSNGSSWETVTAFDKEESPRYYTHELTKGAGRYRVHIVTWKGENLYSDVIAVDDASSYYLYNVGARQWICCANNWGTRASLISHGGHDVMAKQGANGKYTIDTQLQNTENENMHFLNVKDNEPWMDQVSGDWTITEVGSANGQPTYLLSNSGGNMAYDGTTTALVMSSETGVNAQWIFQTREDRMKLLEKATANNPVDATFLIAGNHFDRYDKRNSQWQGSPALGGYFAWNAGNQVAEKFNTNFDVYQVVSGAPAGNYQLKVQGYYRHGGYADAAGKHNGGTERLNAKFYVNSQEAPLQSIFTEAGKNGDIGATTTGINGRFPNGMSDAAQYFLKGLYENSMDFTLNEAGDLRIGVKKTIATTNDWTCFDNFRLIYLGNDEVARTTAQSAAGHSWSTFYSGVASYRLPEGATAYTATIGSGELLLHKLGSVIPQGCAVIIVSSSEGQLTMEKTTETAAAGENDLQGADTDTWTSSYQGTVFVMGASTGADFGFHRYTGLELPAGKAFLVLPAGQSRSLTVRFDDATTALDGLSRQTTDGKVFNLQGQRVATPRKGLYVKDGNKVVVK